MKLAIQRAIEWIAMNDDAAEMDVRVVETYMTVVLIADLHDRTPYWIAKQVVALRERVFSDGEMKRRAAEIPSDAEMARRAKLVEGAKELIRKQGKCARPNCDEAITALAVENTIGVYCSHACRDREEARLTGRVSR